MPNVRELYLELRKSGLLAKDAAREAQLKTGFSLVTGKPIKGSKIKTKKKWLYGESDG